MTPQCQIKKYELQLTREKDDFYETPIEAVHALLSVESFTGEIWECACGKNRIANVLKDNNYKVFSSRSKCACN